MATARPSFRPASARPRRRWRRIALWAAIALVAALAWFWTPLHGRAVAGASYGARIACSCHFVAARDIAQCRADFEPGMGLVMLSVDDAAKRVTARVPMLSRQTASYRSGEGCVLEEWGR